MYGGGEIDTSDSFNSESLKNFRNILYPNIKYDKNLEKKFFNFSHIAFPAAITPCWHWNEKTKELTEKENIGIIFCNGVNFESNQTADYKNFNDSNAPTEKGTKEERLESLKQFINDITLCLVTAAYRLTKNKNKISCELRVPQFGLGQFANYYDEKSILMKLYLQGIKKALKNIKFRDIKWNVKFFNFSQNKIYDDLYKEIFTKMPENIETKCFGKDISIFSNPILDDENKDHLTVIAHAGDQHSFLGNGGFNDNSFEKCLTGYNNDHFLTAIHLLNLFLPDIILTNEENKSKTICTSVVLVGLVILLIYFKKRNYVQDAKNYINNYFENIKKRLNKI